VMNAKLRTYALLWNGRCWAGVYKAPEVARYREDGEWINTS
jgi:hypothetical protein